MSNVSGTLLNNTLNVIALARETALARGVKDQADRMTPVVNGLRTVATAARQPARQSQSATPAPAPAPAAATAPAEPTGVLAQDDFKTLLVAAQKAPLNAPSAASQDRGQVVAAMAAGGMGEVDIARHLGVSREEVRLRLSAGSTTTGRASANSVKSYWR